MDEDLEAVVDVGRGGFQWEGGGGGGGGGGLAFVLVVDGDGGTVLVLVVVFLLLYLLLLSVEAAVLQVAFLRGHGVLGGVLWCCVVG